VCERAGEKFIISFFASSPPKKNSQTINGKRVKNQERINRTELKRRLREREEKTVKYQQKRKLKREKQNPMIYEIAERVL
jgi:hypothetical protein